MALTADQWHILAICLFPVINVIGIATAVFLSGRKNKLLLSSGVLFSAGVLLSGALVHMLAHSTEILNEHFGESHATHGAHADEEYHHDEHEDAHYEDHDEYELHEEHADEEYHNDVNEDAHYEDHEDKLHEEHHDEDEGDHHGDKGDHHDEDGDHFLRRLQEGEEHSHPFPWSYTIFSIAFLFLLCIEVSVERFIDKHFGDQVIFAHGSHENDNHDHSTSKDNSKSDHSHSPNADCIQCDVEEVKAGTMTDDKFDEEDQAQSLPAEEAGEANEMDNRTDEEKAKCIMNGEEFAASITSINARKVNPRRSAWAVTAPRPSVVALASAPRAPLLDEDHQQQTVNPWVAILLTLILSIHVFIEGLTLGSSQDVVMLRNIFIAVVVHKGFSAFSLGSSLVASGYWEKGDEKNTQSSRVMFCVLSAIFICTDILGIGIGIALGKNYDSFSATGLGSGILLALLGGSFLFVAAVELIPGEFEKMRVFKLPIIPLQLSLLGGFALMSLVGAWV